MRKVQVTAQVPEKKDEKGNVVRKAIGPATIEIEYPTDLKEAREMYGDEPVLSNALSNFKVTIQSAIRSALIKGEDQATMQARLGTYKMGVAVQKGVVDSKAAFLAKFQTATPAEQKKMLAELQALAANTAGK